MHITLICADDDRWALGMRSVSSALRAAGHETRMIFAGSSEASLNSAAIDRIAALARPSYIIGVSSMSRSAKRAKALLAGLRPLKKLTVWGGMHPTIYPEDCAPHADLICRGEGEEFMVDLAERMTAERGYFDILNGGFRENGHVQLNRIRPLIANLDVLRWPDFGFENEFVLDGDGDVRPHGRMRDEPSILLSGSRGCLSDCHSCSNAQLRRLYKGKGRHARRMTVAALVEAARASRQMFPRAESIVITDEDFLARPVKEIREFASAYPAKVGLPFKCTASPLQITDTKMKLLARAGMCRIDVSVESGSDETKRLVFNRPVDNESVLRAAAAVGRHPQIVARYVFVIGNPYEKRFDLLETVGLLRQLPPPYIMRARPLVFIPGTELFEQACRDGIIRGRSRRSEELDLRPGPGPNGRARKKGDLYLNTLLSLMTGKGTRRMIGLLPRAVIPALTAPGVVDFCDRHVLAGKMLACLGKGIERARRSVLRLGSGVRKDSTAARMKSALKKLRPNGRAPLRAAS